MEFRKFNPPPEACEILNAAPGVIAASTISQLIDLSCGGPGSSYYEVAYEVEGKGWVTEATVARVRNGVAANYLEAYMRRRDPECMVIGDQNPTDKTTFQTRFGTDFDSLRKETFNWLKKQELLIFGFVAGQKGMGTDALVIAPANAGFFALSLAMLQGIIPYDEIEENFDPHMIIYVAPPFRHTRFSGEQVVVHNRLEGMHELYSYNLYPGPSAKKGVYGVLISLGEKEGWITTHCSTAQLVTPYDNVITIMHEGASGGGKSEMLEQVHRMEDGRILLGENIITKEARHLEIPRTCDIRPVTDDMALCHPSIQTNNRKLSVVDAEKAWFLRVNHIDHYGTDVQIERLTAEPSEPLLFLNIDAVPGSRALIWEHVMDSPGKRCPNPRVIIPRRIIPEIVNEPVSIDIRSMGIRTPPCTKENPTYGIIGLFHILPPALAWLWRLVAPRGYDNPSIVSTEGMSSEGVGSYWPFATGRRVDQANLLFQQFKENTKTNYVLIPNQYIGAWKVGFMPEWIAREYLARRGNAKFRPEQIRKARSPLLGYTMHQLLIEGRMVARWFLQVDSQPEVGEEAYDIGAGLLNDFFKECLNDYLDPELDPLGRQIIDCCLQDGSIEDYEALIK
jgi:hypothetical protein